MRNKFNYVELWAMKLHYYGLLSINEIIFVFTFLRLNNRNDLDKVIHAFKSFVVLGPYVDVESIKNIVCTLKIARL